MCERIGDKIQVILTNNFRYEGIVIDEDKSFITIRDRFEGKISINKKDIQVIKEVLK